MAHARYLFAALPAALLAIPLAAGTRAANAPATAVAANKHPGMVRAATVSIDKRRHQVSVSGSFWNEKVCSWLDVAMSGRPSDFLHETVVCAATTRGRINRALKAIGCRTAAQWAPNALTFSDIRGDCVEILIRFKRHQKTVTYPLDELIGYQPFGGAVGPVGWMYMGEAPGAGRSQAPAASRSSGRDHATKPPAAGNRWIKADHILTDDQQIALNFQGIQHASQSFIDLPLVLQQWIYPSLRYWRNFTALPMKYFDSNGKVPVEIIFRKVSERGFLKSEAAHWHDPAFAAYIRKYLPVAAQIDRLKKSYLSQKAANAAALDVSHLTALYARLDYAWVRWTFMHSKILSNVKPQIAIARRRGRLYRQHMKDVKEAARFRYLAQKARFDYLANAANTPAENAKRAKWVARSLADTSRAELVDNRQPLAYWTGKLKHLDPHDPRKQWIAQIHANLNEANSRERLGKAGVTFAKALATKTPKTIAAARTAYTRAAMRCRIAILGVALQHIKFDIYKFASMKDTKALAPLKQRQAAIEQRIAMIQAMLKGPGGGNGR